MSDTKTVVTITTNRKAEFHYEIIETVESGMVLHGHEIKSICNYKISLDGSYAEIKNQEMWLIKCKIEPYHNAKNVVHELGRPIKLLLKKAEIIKFSKTVEQRGFTIVPLKVIIKNRKAKVILAVVKGKKEWDKRQSLKERDAEREIKNI